MMDCNYIALVCMYTSRMQNGRHSRTRNVKLLWFQLLPLGSSFSRSLLPLFILCLCNWRILKIPAKNANDNKTVVVSSFRDSPWIEWKFTKYVNWPTDSHSLKAYGGAFFALFMRMVKFTLDLLLCLSCSHMWFFKYQF